jgi:ion channel-forming bestrophin family protein
LRDFQSRRISQANGILRTALNLIAGFALALKHKLRFEPGIDHDDLRPFVQFVDSFARSAADRIERPSKKSLPKQAGEYLGVPFAESNPRKYVKRASEEGPIGNLPLEILKYLSSYTDNVIGNGTLTVGMYQTHVLNGISSLNEAMAGCERVLNTPLPIAYSIAISQMTWVYVVMLPFQLWDALRWLTIPGTIFGAYIILGLSAIGREIENPFGNDVNDLPLEAFCDELINDINILTASPSPSADDFIESSENLVLFPQSGSPASVWVNRSKESIREALMRKADANLVQRRSVQKERNEDVEEHQDKVHVPEHTV